MQKPRLRALPKEGEFIPPLSEGHGDGRGESRQKITNLLNGEHFFPSVVAFPVPMFNFAFYFSSIKVSDALEATDTCN